MKAAVILLDRTAVLFLGVAAGAAIGYAFGVKDAPEASYVAPAEMAQADAGADVALPPPTGEDGPAPVKPAAAGALPEPPVTAETRAIQPGIVNAIAAGRPVRIGVFGDSFGDGIWTALYNQLSRKSGYQVVKFSQQATGFTRYRTLNLETHDRARLAQSPVDVAVISFGANDMMGVADGGHVYALLTPKWQAAIARRVTSYVAMLREQGAIVYWVGLPKMREAAYDADVVRMNAFYRDLMGRLGVPFIETAPYSVDASGRYSAYLPDPATGKPMLMRANDGIHMSYAGYVRITKGLAGRIRSYVDQARARAGGSAPPPPVVAAPPEALAPAPKSTPKPVRLDDPLADEHATSSRPSAPAPESKTEGEPRPKAEGKAEPRAEKPKAPASNSPAKGAPADLLPPDIGAALEEQSRNRR
ncbi:MAG: GDSL-type esterase/lipase family protein [Pseudomonadota bacterium]